MNYNKIVTAVIIFLLVVVFGNSLLPFSNEVFTFHDETQPARIMQFTDSLLSLKFPPRIAPDFSFGFGYPVFNYYAPLAYWVASFVNILGFSVINSFKLTMFFGLLLSSLGCYLFLKLFFKKLASIVGSLVYITSLYVAVDIFVRGNMAEIWFLASFPFVLFFGELLRQKVTVYRLVSFIISLACLLVSHNVLSLFVIPIIFVYWWFFWSAKKVYLFSFFVALGIVASYLLPYIMQMDLVHAKSVAVMTSYTDHFLCIGQYWSMAWGYGGSTPGCVNDGMSFMLGKIHIMFFLLGMIFLLKRWFYDKLVDKNLKRTLFFVILTVGSLFMPLYWAELVWNMLLFVLQYVQFPWRFIIFSLLGMAFVTAFAWEEGFNILKKISLPKFLRSEIFFSFIFLFLLIFFYLKYFQAPMISHSEFESKYLSEIYVKNEVVYKIPEYLPKTADFDKWQGLKEMNNEEKGDYLNKLIVGVNTVEDKKFQKVYELAGKGSYYLPVHWFPSWKIFINDKIYQPVKFNSLGMPEVKVEKSTKVVLKYGQSNIQIIGNFVTMVTVLALAWLVFINKFKQKKILEFIT